jgi:hypothetical protein
MLHAPLVVAAFHLALLALFFAFAYRAARHAFDPWGAVAIAAFPLLAEPTRELLSWPTAAQPLLAARGDKRRILVLTLAACGLYVVGRTIAFSHGAGLPPRAPLAEALLAFPLVFVKSLDAQIGIATLDVVPRRAIALATLALVLAAIALATRSGVRARLKERGALLLAGALWFVLGVFPLAFAAGLWTPRHTSLPSLGLGLALAGALACASPRLAAVLTGVRLVALLLAPTADARVAVQLEGRTAPMSYLHVVRLQRTADSARRHLVAEFPTLPHGTSVRYWSLPRETQIAFAGAKAVRTWYADTTLTWDFWERFTPGAGRASGPILAFNVEVPDPAVLMKPDAVRVYQQGIDAWEAGQLETAQEAFAQAIRAQQPEVHNFTNETVRLMARIAFMRARFGEADSLNAVDLRMSGPTAASYGMEAMLAITAGASARAEAAARNALRLRPGDPDASAVLSALGKL